MLQEIGRQHVAFSGGHEQFGSTLGIAYTVFNLLSWDEHLSAQIDGAPEVSRWPLALRKKDFLAREARWLSPSSTRSFVRVCGKRARPFLPDTGARSQRRLELFPFEYRCVLNQLWISRSVTEYSLALPTSVTGATASTLRSESSSPYICASLVTGG